MTDTEIYLNQIFSQSAKETENQMKGNVFEYLLDGMGLTIPSFTSDSGKCEIQAVQYSKKFDCNLITFKDLINNKIMNVSQFEVHFRKVVLV